MRIKSRLSCEKMAKTNAAKLDKNERGGYNYDAWKRAVEACALGVDAWTGFLRPEPFGIRTEIRGIGAAGMGEGVFRASGRADRKKPRTHRLL